MDAEQNKGWRRREVLGLALGGFAAAAIGGFEWLRAPSDWAVGYWSGQPDARIEPARLADGAPLEGPASLRILAEADAAARARYAHLSLEVHAADGAPGFVAWALPGKREAPLPSGLSLRTSPRPVLTLHAQIARPDAKKISEAAPIGSALRRGVYFVASAQDGAPAWRTLEVRRGEHRDSRVRVIDPVSGREGLPGRVLFTVEVQPLVPVPAGPKSIAAPPRTLQPRGPALPPAKVG